MKCKIVPVGQRRDGGTRYWCLTHRANATAKYGVAAKRCVAAGDRPIRPDESLDLDISAYPGGVALWGSVPAVYDTTRQPIDRGIHVHARAEKRGHKDIDKTYRRLRVPLKTDLFSDGWIEINEIDAINYMITNVFGFKTTSVNCSNCGFPHLDRDWFAVHEHRKHQCHGCGRQFSDSIAGIGNPLANIREIFGLGDRKSINPSRSISLQQKDYPGGIQIWGSNPAILWTSGEPEEIGIHVHAFSALNDEHPCIDDTYSNVTIDGIKLDAEQIRVYMAQSAMPHLEDRIFNILCPSCKQAHFDQAELAFTPHINHECLTCNLIFRTSIRIKKTIANPFIEVRKQLAAKSPNPLRQEKLGLRPETI